MERVGQRYRTEHDSRCVLHHDGADYQGTVVNISLGGALLRLNDGNSATPRPGAMCVLLLCGKPQVCPVKYTCQVVRRGAEVVVVQFHEIDYGSYKLKCKELLRALTV
jgi:hypothetical protein